MEHPPAIGEILHNDPREVVVFNVDDPRSIVNLVPEVVSNHILAAYRKNPALFSLDERELHRELAKQHCTPTMTENRLRVKFWHEYDAAQTHGRKMNMASVYTGICTRVLFDVLVSHPEKIAWILCPPASYAAAAEEALVFGLEQLRDILAMDHAPGGVLNMKLLDLKVKVVAMLDARVKGAVVQKTLSVNYNAGKKDVAAIVQANSMEDIEKRIKELEERNRKALNLPDPSSPGKSAKKDIVIS